MNVSLRREQPVASKTEVIDVEPPVRSEDAMAITSPSTTANSEHQVGRIVAISGSEVVILLDMAAARLGGGQKALQMGALCKIFTADSAVFGMVSSLSIPIPSQEAEANEMQIAELELIGEAAQLEDGRQGPFQRGVSTQPGLGDGVFRATQDDLRQVYAPPAVSTLRIGSIHQDQSLPAFLVTDDLLGKHFAVLGTTGSGKSCAVALILHKLLEQHGDGHVLLLDPHNEYAGSFGDAAEKLDTGTLQLPYWLFTFEEIVEVIFGTEGKSSPAEIAILRELIPTAKRNFSGKEEEPDFVTVDTPVPYRIGEVERLIDEARGRLDNARESAVFLRLKARINTLRQDTRYSFMFGSLAARDNMAAIVSRIFRIPVDGKPITIVDLSGVPSEVLNVVVSVLCRMTFDFAMLSDRAVSILLIYEEAHRYAPRSDEIGFEPAKRALSRIAKEGRKYGVSLCVVSQRPSVLSTDVLSQCNTVFAMRMSFQNDQECVHGTMSESALSLMESLPSLGNAEAIVVGQGVSVPMRLCLDELPEEKRPIGGTASFSAAWNGSGDGVDFIQEIIARWRGLR